VDQRPEGWEQTVVARLRVGDETALAALFDQYSPVVHGIAAQLVGSADAVDISQEVFLYLWEHPDRFDPTRASLRTFLTVITRRRCIDHLRSSGRRHGREQRASQGPAVPAPDVGEAAVALIAAERVRAALERLPAEQRRAVELAYLEGLTYRGVAAAMGTPEGTAKSRLRMALARLGRELDDWGSGRGAPEWA
jgi:RNA polymerase sigma-70 factor (ECF subfamily)